MPYGADSQTARITSAKGGTPTKPTGIQGDKGVTVEWTRVFMRSHQPSTRVFEVTACPSAGLKKEYKNERCTGQCSASKHSRLAEHTGEADVEDEAAQLMFIHRET